MSNPKLHEDEEYTKEDARKALPPSEIYNPYGEDTMSGYLFQDDRLDPDD